MSTAHKFGRDVELDEIDLMEHSDRTSSMLQQNIEDDLFALILLEIGSLKRPTHIRIYRTTCSTLVVTAAVTTNR